ncbi:MAG: dockerin type I repeat-containing protein [Clostridia bacterium]|nr:dockerin type I repeat-containing protein [Clostridia bacterium]
MKKIVAFILALAMLAGISVLCASAEESTDCFFIPAADGEPGTVTYGFKNPEYWKEVYVYATGGRSEEYGDIMTYPGIKLERKYVDDYGSIYTFTFVTGYYGTLLFNDGTKNDYKAKLKKDFYDYCVEKLGVPSFEADVNIEKSMRYYDGTVVFTASSWEEPVDMPYTTIFNGNCYHRSTTFSPYELGVYVSTNDEIYTLEEAFDLEGFFGVSMDHGFSGFESHQIYRENQDIDLVHKCMYAFGERYGYKPEEGEGIYAEHKGYIGDNLLFHAYYSHYAYLDVITEEQIGDYYFYAGQPRGIGEKNSVSLYILTPDNKVYTLYEAFKQGVVTDLEAVAKLTSGKPIYGEYGKRILELLDIDITDKNWNYIYEQISPYKDSYYDTATPDFVTVTAAESTLDEGYFSKRIGEYVIRSDARYAPYDLGYYVYFTAEDKVYDLETSLEKYPQLQEKLLRSLDESSAPHYRLIGDAENDGKLNVRDATNIQKFIAGLGNAWEYDNELYYDTADFNGDGKVNVRDATAIQKVLAHIE